MQKIVILTSKDNGLKSFIENFFKSYNQNIEIFLKDKIDFSSKDFDLVLLENYYSEIPEEFFESGNIYRIHPSLLPAFNCSDAVQKAFLSSVKVSGITIHKMPYDENNMKIIAQYPILIDCNEHFDEFQAKINELENIMVPPVIKSILEDKVFEWNSIHKGKCSNGCNCSNCGKNCG